MTELSIESNRSSIWQTIKNFFQRIFNKTNHKCACGSKCTDNCFCKTCIITIAYEEDSEDDSDDGIVMTPNKIVVT